MIKRLAVVFLLVVLERVGLFLPLASGFVMANLIVFSKKDRAMFLFAFLAGLIIDLVFLNKLGVSSIVFLVARGLFLYFNAKFEQSLPWVLAAVAFLGTLVSEWWLGYGLRVIYGVSAAVVSIVFFMFIKESGSGGVFVRRRR